MVVLFFFFSNKFWQTVVNAKDVLWPRLFVCGRERSVFKKKGIVCRFATKVAQNMRARCKLWAVNTC